MSQCYLDVLRKSTRIGLLVFLICAWGTAQDQKPKIRLDQEQDLVTVTVDGELFTRYHTGAGTRPCLWPIVGPSGKAMTRAFPLQQNVPGESGDHIHHRSLWFAHGSVNKVDFWSEGPEAGKISHQEFVKVQSEPTAILETKNTWTDTDGKHVCTDVRVFQFGANADRRWIDLDVTILADGDSPVDFGDTKEGTFGIRVADSIKVDAPGKGHIVNSLEIRDEQAWGKKASWVDYYGPIDGETVGIAVLNHPNSFRFPPYWHIRTYGLMASNVFGAHNFENANDRDGAFTLPVGESIAFFYRVILHKGDEQQGRVPEAFAEYVKEEKPSTAVAGAVPSDSDPGVK
jgi:Methane oxygenase PmoA